MLVTSSNTTNMSLNSSLNLGLGGEYYVDDVCLSQRGAHHMKQLEAEMGITHTRRKRRFKNETTEKDAGESFC